MSNGMSLRSTAPLSPISLRQYLLAKDFGPFHACLTFLILQIGEAKVANQVTILKSHSLTES